MSILVVAAHPDDEVLGCGATIAKLAKKHEVTIAILGEGMTSRAADSEVHFDRSAVEMLQANAKKAARLLGAKQVLFDLLPDNRFDQVPLLDVVKRVEAIIQRVQPTTIYTHHPGDLNIDHAITFRAVLTATRPLAGCLVHDVYAFEVPSSTEWAFQRFEPIFRPNVFVDVSSTIELKTKAMETYASEVRDFPHPRSAEALLSIARRWGSVVGLEYAEAFELIRSVRSG